MLRAILACSHTRPQVSGLGVEGPETAGDRPDFTSIRSCLILALSLFHDRRLQGELFALASVALSIGMERYGLRNFLRENGEFMMILLRMRRVIRPATNLRNRRFREVCGAQRSRNVEAPVVSTVPHASSLPAFPGNRSRNSDSAAYSGGTKSGWMNQAEAWAGAVSTSG